MLNQSRLLLGVLGACAASAIPFFSASAQDAVANQAYAQMNQVQADLQSGLINSSQASDLMNRYNNVVSKDAQYTMQDGGSLNVPDRLGLMGQLKGTTKRLNNDLKNNGVPTSSTGISSLFGSVLGTTPVSTLGTTYPNSAYATNPYAVNPYATNLYATNPYATTTYPSTYPYAAGLTTSPYLSSVSSPYTNNYLRPYSYSTYPTTTYPTTTIIPSTGILNSASGYLSRWRGY